MFVAVFDDLLRGALVDAGHVAHQRPGGCVEVHAHAVDAGFDGGLQALLQAALVHVVLVLAHADRLRVDLYQLRERILQAPGDGNGAAHGEIEIGKLLAGDFRGRIHGSAGFAHRDAENMGELGLAQKVFHQRGAFARRRAVADGDGLHVEARHQAGQGLNAAHQVVFGLEGIDDRMLQEFAGIVHHGDLAAGADAGVDGQHGEQPGGR